MVKAVCEECGELWVIRCSLWALFGKRYREAADDVDFALMMHRVNHTLERVEKVYGRV